jgi:anti-anti-sigma factor
MEIAKQLSNGTYNIILSGKFTFADSLAFREIIQKIEEKDVQQAVLDMSHVELIDSAALGMLLLAREAAAKNSKQIILSGATGQPKKMFDMAKFDTMFTLR